MKLCDFYQILNKYAPIALSEEFCARYGAYDNSGVLVDTGKRVQKALFSLDLTNAAIEKAVALGATVIVTHHPAIYGKIGDIQTSELLGGKLIKCIENGISVVSMHLNLDGAKDGIDESLAEAVCLAAGGEKKGEEIMLPLTDGGYGRVYALPRKIAFSELVKQVKRVLGCENICVFGNGESIMERVASFCGAGADEEALAFAVKCGAGAIVSSDWKHHTITAAVEKGICVIAPTHYASEFYGFKKYYEKISRETEISCHLHEDKAFL